MRRLFRRSPPAFRLVRRRPYPILLFIRPARHIILSYRRPFRCACEIIRTDSGQVQSPRRAVHLYRRSILFVRRPILPVAHRIRRYRLAIRSVEHRIHVSLSPSGLHDRRFGPSPSSFSANATSFRIPLSQNRFLVSLAPSYRRVEMFMAHYTHLPSRPSENDRPRSGSALHNAAGAVAGRRTAQQGSSV